MNQGLYPRKQGVMFNLRTRLILIRFKSEVHSGQSLTNLWPTSDSLTDLCLWLISNVNFLIYTAHSLESASLPPNKDFDFEVIDDRGS
jgi:hypothetical protein